MYEAAPAGARMQTSCGRSDQHMIFLVELIATPNALARMLCPFAVLEADLAAVELVRRGGGSSVRIEVAGLDRCRAGVLARKLERSPVVASVTFGWLSVSGRGS